jgi:hypothetical protein
MDFSCFSLPSTAPLGARNTYHRRFLFNLLEKLQFHQEIAKEMREEEEGEENMKITSLPGRERFIMFWGGKCKN